MTPIMLSDHAVDHCDKTQKTIYRAAYNANEDLSHFIQDEMNFVWIAAGNMCLKLNNQASHFFYINWNYRKLQKANERGNG